MQDEQATLSRRTFLGATAALGAASVMPLRGFAAAEKPNSKFNGVQIGTITYSFRSLPGSAEDLLKYCVQCGISSIELMGGPAEKYAKNYVNAHKDEAEADPMVGFKALKKLYDEAGVAIHIAKFGNIGNKGMSDEQIDYYFQAAKALGATGITRELSEDAGKRLGALSEAHQVWIGFHNHTQLKPTTYDGDILTHGKYLGINFDIGHYVAGTGESPVAFIEKYHERIISLHVKDRKKGNGPNMPFGEGETGVAEVLQHMKKNKLAFPGDIELEYKVPKESDALKEVTKCVEFCRQALA